MIAHRDIAIETGCIPEHVLVCEDGDVVVLEDGRASMGESVRSGMVFIDGLLPDVGPAVLRDRNRLANDGICVCIVQVDQQKGRPVGDVVLIQKGVVFDDMADDIIDGAVKAVNAELDGLKSQKFNDLQAVQRHVTQALGRYWRSETGRRPVILPVVLDV